MSLALEEGNYTTVMTNGRSSLFILGNVYYLSCARLRELNWPEFDKYTRGGERERFLSQNWEVVSRTGWALPSPIALAINISACAAAAYKNNARLLHIRTFFSFFQNSIIRVCSKLV